MGKKRLVTTDSQEEGAKKVSGASRRRTLSYGTLYVRSTYNNTALSIADEKGNIVLWSSSGALGFKGAKKGTPFAAAKVGEALAEKAGLLGLKEISVVVSGVGSGRESAIRGFISKGVSVRKIKDATPVPHNGPRAPKPRRV
ncbi:MAG: 30S ribosomal protein S11 [Candidatus Taylorbacteria bacterium]|nr:30S ribosomal protein S11 [Candidatus Taylorbacteria bacterium]